MEALNIENGYTQIPNELLEVLMKTKLNNATRRLLDAIIRQTYGYHRKYALLSLRKLCEMIDLPIRSVRRARDNLLKMNMNRSAHICAQPAEILLYSK